MADLALDLTTGDLLLEDDAARLTNDDDGESVAQSLYITLGMWEGDYVLDRNQGIPYQRLLGRKDSKARLESRLRTEALTVPGVERVDQVSIDVDENRHGVATVNARTADNEPVEVEFDAGVL